MSSNNYLIRSLWVLTKTKYIGYILQQITNYMSGIILVDDIFPMEDILPLGRKRCMEAPSLAVMDCPTKLTHVVLEPQFPPLQDIVIYDTASLTSSKLPVLIPFQHSRSNKEYRSEIPASDIASASFWTVKWNIFILTLPFSAFFSTPTLSYPWPETQFHLKGCDGSGWAMEPKIEECYFKIILFSLCGA